MKLASFLLPALVGCLATAAPSAITVIGSTSASLCYEAAESELPTGARSLGDCDRALNEEALTDYEVVATHVNRGILYMRTGAMAAALADFDAAIARDPGEAEAYLNKAVALMRSPDRPRDALALFTAALDHKTRKPALAYFGRALAHERLGDVKAAYFDYKRASAADPSWAQPAAELARFSVRRR